VYEIFFDFFNSVSDFLIVYMIFFVIIFVIFYFLCDFFIFLVNFLFIYFFFFEVCTNFFEYFTPRCKVYHSSPYFKSLIDTEDGLFDI